MFFACLSKLSVRRFYNHIDYYRLNLNLLNLNLLNLNLNHTSLQSYRLQITTSNSNIVKFYSISVFLVKRQPNSIRTYTNKLFISIRQGIPYITFVFYQSVGKMKENPSDYRHGNRFKINGLFSNFAFQFFLVIDN